ncbi:class D sortase [Evansella cellulosilytica]|uniref:Sortase family protein n=1 Tax=Evansella cellulosilytica (strain ATCC 21833 / DSM 2522 / FERM P-1141 / JCM 9156 / N-4) TaxID=649639 RepID=E6TTG3_EVAC2|nr:class D sortase [Evansella cellulosilytica]ADU29599.1 sortase family protein [Evansella cellulosilytica DSM 2522]
MGRWISFLLLVTGLIFVSVNSYQIFAAKSKHSDSLQVAQKIILESEGKGSEELIEDGILEDIEPELGEIIGIISIPSLNDEWAIVEGTREEDLDVGVGHYFGTAYPAQGKQVFLAGHRDTVFSELNEITEGDIIEIQMSYGTFQYEVSEMFIVDAEDRTVIDYSTDEEVLTLCTCYPFRYVGPAPDRYIINATPL